MKTSQHQLIYLATGGTGGHVMPAICVAQSLIDCGHEVLFITDQRGKNLIPQNFSVKVIDSASPFAGRMVSRISALFKLVSACIQSFILMLKQRPDAILGFGGYPAAGPMLTGYLLSVPVLLHEQNAVMGRTNRWLSHLCRAVLVSWPETSHMPEHKNIIDTGLPVRADFLKITPYQVNKARPKEAPFHLVIFGGSLGAALFADIIPKALANLPAELKGRLQITHQVRAEQQEALKTFYEKEKMDAVTQPFFTRIAEIFEKADLVICRAGASSVAELAIAGRPAIFIPFGKAADDHQSANARQLSQIGGAIDMREDSLSAEKLTMLISALMTQPEKCLALAQNAMQMARPDAAEKIMDHIIHYTSIQAKEAA